MMLEFNNYTLPRTITREQWRLLDRWRRKCDRAFVAEMSSRFKNLVVFGTTHPEIFDLKSPGQ